MNSIKNFSWWITFIIIAICLQSISPGLDALIIGIIILLQEQDYKNLLWILPLFILLQEGMGTRQFGGIIAWYASTILLFKIGRWFFEVENLVFITLLASCLGTTYYFLAWLMAPLQNLPFNEQEMIDKCIIQTLYIPIAWILISFTRTKNTQVENE